jgi:hypothetical protein
MLTHTPSHPSPPTGQRGCARLVERQWGGGAVEHGDACGTRDAQCAQCVLREVYGMASDGPGSVSVGHVISVPERLHSPPLHGHSIRDVVYHASTPLP